VGTSTLDSRPRRRRPATGDEEAGPRTQGDRWVACEPAIGDGSASHGPGLLGQPGGVSAATLIVLLGAEGWVNSRRKVPAIVADVVRRIERALYRFERGSLKDVEASCEG
jgi:hypothetical protein